MENTRVTLGDLVAAVGEFARDEKELVATVAHLVNGGRVRIGGRLEGATIALGVRRPKLRAAAAGA